jgi:phosphate starvation-inducible PhoH-like protein
LNRLALAEKPAHAESAHDNAMALAFDDNRVLAHLLGEHDANLAQLEHRLNVAITVRGNRIAIRGDREPSELARAALIHLYAKAARGVEINRGEVDAALRMVKLAEGKEAEAGVRTRRKTITARTPNQQRYIEQIRKNELVFGVGPAGTGKTYLAVACAAEALMNGEVDRIVLSRPAVEAGERLGFLPGDMKEKVDPYLRPLYDALYDMMPQSLVQKGLEEKQIEIAPLAFMRGRTLSSSFIILDEAQNTTPQQMKMFLTRLGEGSRMVVTGDPTQIDLPFGVGSGLNEALSILDGVKGIGVTRFVGADIVRHPLVGRIVAAYDKKAKAAKPKA